MTAHARDTVAACAIAGMAVLAACLLASGWDGLEATLPGGLPLGNAVSAASLVLGAWAAFRLSAPGSWVRRFAAFALAVALSWLPLSIALAGNLELNFSGSTGAPWLAFTAFAAIAAFGSLLAAVAARGMARARSRRA